MQALKGIRVLDLSKVLAGPLCGQYLGELGAEVIKVEPPVVGDDTRAWQPQEKGESASFLAVNHNKRSLAVDLKADEGRALVHRLAARVDVVLQGFGGDTAARLGVDYPTLKAINPKLIYCEISGYGRSGPLGDAPGYDVMLQAFSGMLSTMGETDGPFARASFSPIDGATGMLAMSGVLAALIERGRTGEGSFVEVSLLDTSLALMGTMVQNFWRTGRNPSRMGTGHPGVAPYQAFSASDGFLMMGVANDAQWRKFCPAAGLEDLMNDPDFATNASRVRNFGRTVALVQDRIRTKTVAEWLAILRAAKVPCAPIHSVGDALDHPQVAGGDLIVRSMHPVLGEVKNIGLPIRFDGERRVAHRTAPALGEHTVEVLSDAGYSLEEIGELRSRGIIAARDAANDLTG